LDQRPDTSREQRRDVARVEAFSDGVFAFAITLLVITIRIPRLDDPDASVGLSTTRSASVAELHRIRHHFRGRRHHLDKPPVDVQPRRAKPTTSWFRWTCSN